MVVLEEVSRNRNNNLNLLRFVAAVMVIVNHSYPLSTGGEYTDVLGRLTDGQISLGGLAVCIFFFFSGFFLNRSVNKGHGAYEFFKGRLIRIFPCLMTTVFFSVFVLGACVTTYSLSGYFTNVHTYEYLLNAVLILRHDLPGVFEGNIYNATVNGSLWTLPVEFLCYIVCFFVWRTGLSKEKAMKYTIPFFVLGYPAMHIALARTELLQSALRPCGMFYCGMLSDTYRSRIYIKIRYVLLCIAGLAMTSYLGILEYGAVIFLPYVLIFIVFGVKKKLNKFATNHEISYGIYLSAWPIQQTIVMISGGSMDPILNTAISIPLAVAAGYLLNILVDKRVMVRTNSV